MTELHPTHTSTDTTHTHHTHLQTPHTHTPHTHIYRLRYMTECCVEHGAQAQLQIWVSRFSAMRQAVNAPLFPHRGLPQQQPWPLPAPWRSAHSLSHTHTHTHTNTHTHHSVHVLCAFCA